MDRIFFTEALQNRCKAWVTEEDHSIMLHIGSVGIVASQFGPGAPSVIEAIGHRGRVTMVDAAKIEAVEFIAAMDGEVIKPVISEAEFLRREALVDQLVNHPTVAADATLADIAAEIRKIEATAGLDVADPEATSSNLRPVNLYTGPVPEYDLDEFPSEPERRSGRPGRRPKQH